MLLFTQARPTPLPLSKPLGVSLPITLIAAGYHPATLLDALRSKSAAACLNAWRTSFARPSSQGCHFLSLKGGIKNLLQPSYAKGEG